MVLVGPANTAALPPAHAHDTLIRSRRRVFGCPCVTHSHLTVRSMKTKAAAEILQT